MAQEARARERMSRGTWCEKTQRRAGHIEKEFMQRNLTALCRARRPVELRPLEARRRRGDDEVLRPCRVGGRRQPLAHPDGDPVLHAHGRLVVGRPVLIDRPTSRRSSVCVPLPRLRYESAQQGVFLACPTSPSGCPSSGTGVARAARPPSTQFAKAPPRASSRCRQPDEGLEALAVDST